MALKNIAIYNRGFENDSTLIGEGFFDSITGERVEDPYGLGPAATQEQKMDASYQAIWDASEGATPAEKYASAQLYGQGNIETGVWAYNKGYISGEDVMNDPGFKLAMSEAGPSGAMRVGRLAFNIGAGIMLGGAASAAFGAATGAASGTGAAAGEGIAMSSTPASIGEMVSTPALTSFSGPTGTSLLSTEVATATLGVGEGLAAGGLGGVEYLDSGAAAQDLGISSPSVARSAASGLSGSDLALASMAAPQLMSMFAGEPEMDAGAAAMDMGVAAGDSGVSKPEDPGSQGRARQFETRRQAAGRAARGAGSVRSGNEADLLGQNAQKVNKGPRKAGQGGGRKLLGY